MFVLYLYKISFFILPKIILAISQYQMSLKSFQTILPRVTHCNSFSEIVKYMKLIITIEGSSQYNNKYSPLNHQTIFQI